MRGSETYEAVLRSGSAFNLPLDPYPATECRFGSSYLNIGAENQNLLSAGFQRQLHTNGKNPLLKKP
jgi:hypothetical protein